MKLNIGAGGIAAKGWVNADIAPSVPGVMAADMRQLPWADEVFDLAVCHHALHFLGYLDVVPALAELRRVLKNGAYVRISVPNLVAGVRAHARGDGDWFPKIVGDETSVDGRFCAWLTGYGTSRTVFTHRWLAELCLRAGFTWANPCPPGLTYCDEPEIQDLDSRAGESAFVEARR